MLKQFNKGLFSAIILVSLTSLILISSCSKSEIDKPWELSISTNSYNDAASIFKSVGKTTLLNIANSKNDAEATELVKNIAGKVGSYVYDKYKIDISKDYINDPVGVLVVGLVFAERERLQGLASSPGVANNSITPITNKADFGCFRVAVEGFLGITQAKEIWTALVAGVSERTVLGLLSFIGKKVAVTISVVWLVYDIGECMDWW